MNVETGFEEVWQPISGKIQTHRKIVCFAVTAVILISIAVFLAVSGTEEYVTAPGFLTVQAYALDPESDISGSSTVMEEGIDFPLEFAWSNGLNRAFGMPIYVSVDDDALAGKEITWEITLADGHFYKGADGPYDSGTVFAPERGEATEDQTWFDDAYLGTHFTVPNQTMLLWTDITYDPENFGIYVGESTFAQAVVRADGHIIGYVVIEICGLPSPLDGADPESIACYIPKLVASKYYPMVNGEFQEITEEYILEQITSVTDKRKTDSTNGVPA